MKASTRTEGDVVVISLSGKLMGGPDAESVRQLIRESLEAGKKEMIIDIGDVSWVNSTGLGILIASHVTVSNAGGTLKLSRVSKRISQIFMVTKLHTVFETHESIEEALQSFTG
ncbi:MAG: STAS domain-containing protein [Candidatus Eisenbacteria sp.]|nr:STAS domain-containing protein [Candidatus Eisenbacteria bacterium]